MNMDETFWANKYQEKQTGWDLGTVSPPLKKYIDHLQDKNMKILIPGAGNAYEAEYLFSLGFSNVYVLDLAKEPLVNFLQRRQDFPKEQLLHQDFFKLEDSFDLILEQTFFCALLPETRKDYAQKANELLKPGGKVAGVLFDVEFPHSGPPFGGKREDYLEIFSPKFEIKVFEPCNNSIPPRSGSELFFIFKKN